MRNFYKWLEATKQDEWLKIKESSPFTRTRLDTAKGLKPNIPPIELNAHITATPADVPGALQKKAE